MKNYASLVLSYMDRRDSRRNILILIRFLLVLTGLITIYSILFHVLMEREGQEHTWLTGLYWTLTVMSTLGFGDITFHTDTGRIFSMLVLMTGMVFMLTLLPFTFIQFFYAPWMAAQSAARIRRSLPPDTEGHVIVVNDGEVTRALMRKLQQFRYPYVLLVANMQDALDVYDEGIPAVVGELDNPQTYRNVQIEKAALLVTAASDVVNVSVASTARGLSETVRILATAQDEDSVDILELSGCNHVLRFGDMMGRAMARRLVAGDAMTHVVGSFGDLIIAEATAANTPLVGKTLSENRLREILSVNVVGLWQRGDFKPATPESLIEEHSVLVLAGSRSQLDEYDQLLCIYNISGNPVVIIGGGRVGRAAGEAMKQRSVEYRIVEKLAERIRDDEHYVHGSAADIDVLKKAGIMESPAVVITTHEDDLNVYLTIYCRRLRPDIQIITRANTERIVGALHRAGADFVMSYASMGANTMFNLLKRSDVLMVTEGLDLFKVRIPPALVGKSIAQLGVRKETGCTIVAYQENGEMHINPDPSVPLPGDCEIIVIGSVEAEDVFLNRFVRSKPA